MSMKCLERAFSLLIAVLMVTTAFIPAVGAAEPNRAASSVNTATDSFSGTTTFTAGTSTPASGAVSNGHGTAKAEKDPPLFSRNNWSQPTSWTNTSVDIENAGEPGVDASPAAGAARVVTGSGKTKLKVYDRETRIIQIKDDSRSAATGGDDELEIRLVNATPDLGTFTEIFEITAHRTIALDGSEDFLATWALYGGNENATRAEWFVWEELTHSVEIPIIEYREVTLENITSEDTIPVSVTLENDTPEGAILEGVLLDSIADADGTLENTTLENTTPVDVALENVSPEDVTLEAVVQEDVLPEENATPEYVSPEDAALETVTVRDPYIAGTETVEQSWPEWVPFTPDGRTLNAGETRLFKVVYTKPAELGQVDINTAPIFRGVACPEMTWWSTAWAYRVPVTVTNPPLINGYPHSGYPHREVVSFRTGMQRDFDDVRFATDDGIVLDYWKETYATANSAVIWVNLPAGATSIWMYYGNAAATDIGSRDNAYILYDDFNYPDPALWMSSPSGSYYVQNGWIWDEQSRGPGVLVSNNPVITDGEPVIVEMRIFANSLPPRYTFCGYFPQFIDTSPTNGLLWYPIHERRVTMGGATSWQSGSQRGLLPGATCFNTWLITPSSQTHTVSGSVSYSDVFQETTGISNHRMMLFGGDNSVPGRSIRMDWIRVRKYVETEPAFCYGTPQTCPIVTITSPGDDTVGAGGNVTVVGTISSSAVSSLTLTHNNVSSIVPVQDGNFSVEVTLADANTIMANGTDSFGNTFSVTLLLDGDMLPGAFEQEIGFDPLNADSNCSGWPEDQSGNGVIDGYEIFAGDLPVFAKYRIGANPFVADTDGDGLNDSFELLKLGTFPEQDEILAVIHSTEGNHSVAVGVGTDDDPDGDGLSNYEEQGYGTDPLSADTDDDGLSDADEISMWTCPCDADSDDDGLADGAEVALGTNATDPYSGGDGIPDGAKDYWSGERFLDDTLDLTVFGRGYAVANVSAAEVNYTHLISEEILVSKVAAIGFGDDIESGTIEIAYDPTHVENASRLSVYRFDEDLGTFVNVSSTVDSENWVVSCEAAGSAKYAIMDSARWDALFDEEPLASLMASSVSNYATVHVTDAVTGNPVGNATVTFTCLSDGFVYAYVTDSNGYTSTSYSDASNIQYQITKTGYRTFTGLLKADPVYDQEHITIHPSIVPTNAPCGNIDVDTDPDGADIYVDGVLRGGSPHVVVNLLEDDHTVEVKMTGYESASTPVPVYGGQITPVAFDLSPVLGTGTIWVSTGPGGAQVYLDGVYKGVTDENEELTISDVPVGNHRVVIQKDGYIPVTRVVTVELNETTNISVALNNDDLDEDGLLDGFENGYRDGFGRWHTVDPYAIDTDGDGLSDGFEAGESVTDENGTTYFRPRSDPNKADTDDDGLDDLAEFEYGADPFNPDTDGDGLRDGADPDPLTPAASGDINLAKIAREILAGAVFGETGLPDGSFYWLVGEETASSPYYMVGWIGFSCLPVVGGIADIRDAVQAILNGDAIGAAMNAAGAIPGPGDGIKITGAIVCYTGKFPWKARELGVLLSKELLGPLPDTIKIQVWDLLFDGAGSRLVRGEIGAGDVAKVIEQNGNIERTLSVIKRTDGKVFWLEEGKLGTAEGATSWVYDEKGGSGWVHIVNNHINHPNGNQFEDAFGDAYKGDHNLIKDLIMDCAKTGLLDPNNPGHYWKKIGDRYLIAVVGSNGYLVTSHPVKNTDVPQVIKNMFS